MLHAFALSFMLADEVAQLAARDAVLTALDAVTTRDNLRHGARENNFFARPFVRTDAGTLVYFTVSALVTDAVGHLIHRSSPRAARTYLDAVAGFEAYCVAHNLGVRGELNK